MRELAKQVLDYIHSHGLVRTGERVGVAVSGGADSVALLRVLLELRKDLGIVLSVVHFNHQLRGGQSDAEQQFVADLATRHKLQSHMDCGDVRRHSADKRLSVEAAGRKLRYQFFVRLFDSGCVDRIATAHTLDDQAESVILRVVRGAGTRGLAGVYPEVFHAEHQSVIRPLLGIERLELRRYLAAIGQDWREDPSNRDLRNARNLIRHGILPRLQRHLNPEVRQRLAETAEIARAEEEYWKTEVSRILPQLWDAATVSAESTGLAGGGRLQLGRLVQLPLALQRRVIRAAAEGLGLRLEFGHVESMLRLISGSTGSAVALPADWRATLRQDEVCFEPAHQPPHSDYDYRLTIPGRVEVLPLSTAFEATLIPPDAARGYNSDELLDPGRLGAQLRVRNWRAGDRFWPAHTKTSSKIKELLQKKHVTGRERQLWPVITSDAELIWVRGFPTPARLQPKSVNGPALLIREMKLADPGDPGPQKGA